MNTPGRLGGYALGLAVVFAGAFGVGSAAGVADTAPGRDTAAVHAGGHAGASPAPREAAAVPGGLQVSQHGYTLVPERTTVTPGAATDFRFTVLGPGGRPVTAYRTEHEKKLHLIVVGRDLSGYRHLHPVMTPDGVWSVTLDLPKAGDYRVFADFVPEGAGPLTLGVDVHAPGDYAPQEPPLGRTATVDGYTVRLDGPLIPGRTSRITARISRDGRPVTDLEPYLGAYGHLVALRAGDLAYLHAHPEGAPGDGVTPAGPELAFHVEVPSPGDYRLYLDFQHGGSVRTAAFTVRAEQRTEASQATPMPGESEHLGH